MKILWSSLLPLAALAQVFPALGDRELRDHLRLTDAQYGALSRNAERHRMNQSRGIQRVTEINRDIESGIALAAPDQERLGWSYQEIESICRRYSESLLELNREQLLALNDQQRAAVMELAEAQRSAQLAVAAAAVLLIPKRDPDVEFRWTDFPPVDNVPAELSAFLSLTSSQLDALQRSVRAHRDFVASRRARVTEVGREIEDELARPSPSAIELGMRYWEIEAQRRQVEERASSLRVSHAGLLTAAQRSRLALLHRTPLQLRIQSQAASNALIVTDAEAIPASQPGRRELTILGALFEPTGMPGLSFATTSPFRSCIAAPVTVIFDPARPFPQP